jgi:hypothetical protein
MINVESFGRGGARRFVDQAEIAFSTIAPATKSLLPSSRYHQPRQSTHLPRKPPHPKYPLSAPVPKSNRQAEYR